jgi:hypothetical protein
MNRGLAIPVIASLVVFGFFGISGDGIPRTARAACKKTEIGSKCGSDANLGPIACGASNCFATVIIFEPNKTCTDNGNSGLTTCSAGDCMRSEMHFECVDGSCRQMGEAALTKVIPISFASGAACNNSPGGPASGELDPPAIQPGPTTGGGG